MQDGRLSAFGTFRTPTGQHLRGWGERRHTIARQSTRPGGPVTCWRDRIDCPNVTGAGTGSFELEAASGDWYVYVRANRVEQVWPIDARGAVY
jgi:hypothetical protein